MPNIKLQSSDGETFEIDIEIAKQSVIIKTMLEGLHYLPSCYIVVMYIWTCMKIIFPSADLGMDDDEEEAVPLPNVNSAILKKVHRNFKVREITSHYDFYALVWLRRLYSGARITRTTHLHRKTTRTRRSERMTSARGMLSFSRSIRAPSSNSSS